MNRLLMLLTFLILSVAAKGQPLNPHVELPDSIIHATPEWVDFNNDGLLDVLLFMESKSTNFYAAIIKGDSIQPLSQVSKVFPIPSPDGYLLADYNRDNAMDIVVSGERNGIAVTTVYLNKGSYNFEKKDVATLPAFTHGRFADLDDDATPELVLSGEGNNGFSTKIFKQGADDEWITIDSLRITCSSIETVDADGDGDVDLFLSGKVTPDSLFSGFAMNKGNFYFKPEHATELAGNTSIGDFNNDGFFEIVLMGENKDGIWVTKMFERTSSGYSIKDLPTTLTNGKPFVADFDYDGYADMNYYGMVANDTVNFIQFHAGGVLQLPKQDVVDHRFGDLKHDANLDLLVLYAADALTLSLSSMAPTNKNLAPGPPQNAVALAVFNRVFMYWEKPADDHTPQQSLTYDVFLEGNKNYKSGEFDLLNQRRLTVSHGNNGTENFKLLKNIQYDGLRFLLQAVDNSFHAGNVCLGGPGSGSVPCATVTTEAISACSDERVTLDAPPTALWFSFANGFLGRGHDFNFAAEVGDTLFYYNPVQGGCSTLKAWAIEIKDDTTKVVKSERFVCEGTILQLNVEPGWDNIHWTSQKKGDLGSAESIQYETGESDSVILALSNSKGCTIIRKTAVQISQPEIQVSPDHFKIIKGAEVRLAASGAQRYLWTPSSWLSQIDIANPIATPASTVQYTVTGFDSLGCTGTAEVIIEVEETGFIPTLFSPNDDGQNDQLKIYGVATAQQFSFSIYDREGALVYRTSNVLDAVQHGWDGTKNGTKQPPGVYFWKVKGELASGPLLLNGKNSGSLVLIR
jgi:gliding motility-associated-like protein